MNDARTTAWHLLKSAANSSDEDLSRAAIGWAKVNGYTNASTPTPQRVASGDRAQVAGDGRRLPTMLPGYGRTAGQPIATASKDDCRFYERGCLRTLDDPSKQRFHAKEQLMLEALRARLRELGEAADYE